MVLAVILTPAGAVRPDRRACSRLAEVVEAHLAGRMLAHPLEHVLTTVTSAAIARFPGRIEPP